MTAPMQELDSRIAWVPSRIGRGAPFLLLVFIACGTGTIDLFSPESGQPIADAAGQDRIADQALISSDATTRYQGEDGEATGDTASQDQIGDQVLISNDVATPYPNEGGAKADCLSDNDCTSSEARRCEPALHVCVQCIGLAGDCANQSKSKCNRVTNKCVLPCSTTGDCSSPDVCDRSQGACAQCLDNSQCVKADEPKCVEENCVQCQGAQDCPPGAHCWQATCVACVTDADCPNGGTCSTDHACN